MSSSQNNFLDLFWAPAFPTWSCHPTLPQISYRSMSWNLSNFSFRVYGRSYYFNHLFMFLCEDCMHGWMEGRFSHCSFMKSSVKFCAFIHDIHKPQVRQWTRLLQSTCENIENVVLLPSIWHRRYHIKNTLGNSSNLCFLPCASPARLGTQCMSLPDTPSSGLLSWVLLFGHTDLKLSI